MILQQMLLECTSKNLIIDQKILFAQKKKFSTFPFYIKSTKFFLELIQ